MIKKTLFALVLTAAAAPVMAQQCAVTVESNDAMQYNVANIDVSKNCKEFVVTLKHVGKLPKNAMGHNLVIAKASDMAGIGSDGMVAGQPNDYVKAKDARVLAHTGIIGGGETSTAKLSVAALNAKDSYVFFCTFPGHSAIMKGTVKLAG